MRRRTPPLRPEPADEGTHDPGPEELWNESWYFDAISDDGGLGVYHRIGRLPNTDACLVTACIVRPGEPAIMLVDSSAPLPPADDEAQAVTTEAIRAEPPLRGAARALPRGGRGHGGRSRRSLGAASQGGRRAGRDRRRPDLGDRRRALCVAPCDPLRDPVPGHRHGPRRRARSSSCPARASAITRGALATGGPSTGCGARCTSTTAPTPTPSRCPTHPDFGVGYVQRGRRADRARPTCDSSEQVADDGLITHRADRDVAGRHRGRP